MSFKRNVKVIHIDHAPLDANIISSQVIFKIKMLHEKSLKHKAWIAPHGNGNFIRHELKSDCPMCSPIAMLILLSSA